MRVFLPVRDELHLMHSQYDWSVSPVRNERHFTHSQNDWSLSHTGEELNFQTCSLTAIARILREK